jgi:cell wall-associated NlpC family hydrolase
MKTIRSTDIVNAALSWNGTPYHHQAAVKGVGVDCAYFIGSVAEECKFIDKFYVAPYSVEWHIHNEGEKMLEIVEGFGCKRIAKPRAGDILAFQYGRSCSHLGIMLRNNTFIHASLKHKRVIIEELRDDYLERHKFTYTFPGVRHDY